MAEYRVYLRETCSYEVFVEAESEQDAEDKAVAMYENGEIYKDLYDYDLTAEAYPVTAHT